MKRLIFGLLLVASPVCAGEFIDSLNRFTASMNEGGTLQEWRAAQDAEAAQRKADAEAELDHELRVEALELFKAQRRDLARQVNPLIERQPHHWDRDY